MAEARKNRFEVYTAMDNGVRGWRVRMVAAENGETLLSGELYVDKEAALALVDRTRTLVPSEVWVDGELVPDPEEDPPLPEKTAMPQLCGVWPENGTGDIAVRLLGRPLQPCDFSAGHGGRHSWEA